MSLCVGECAVQGSVARCPTVDLVGVAKEGAYPLLHLQGNVDANRILGHGPQHDRQPCLFVTKQDREKSIELVICSFQAVQ